MAVLSFRSTCRCVAAVTTIAALAAAATGAAAQSAALRPADEYSLKAAIIYRLAKFVEWPASAFNDAAAPFTVCVIGADPFGQQLEAVMQGHSIAGRPIAIKRLIAVEQGCHVLFVSQSELRRVSVILEQVRNRSVLSIGDDRSFLDQGGIVGLWMQGEHVRFTIRGDAAEQAHLRVSARVQALSSAPGGIRP